MRRELCISASCRSDEATAGGPSRAMNFGYSSSGLRIRSFHAFEAPTKQTAPLWYKKVVQTHIFRSFETIRQQPYVFDAHALFYVGVMRELWVIGVTVVARIGKSSAKEKR